MKLLLHLILGIIITISFSCNPNNWIDSQINSSFNKEKIEFQLPPKKDIRIVVISDLNSQYGSTEYEPEIDKAIIKIKQWKPDLVLSGGDAIAGQKKTLTRSQITAMWNSFDRHIAKPLRENKIPFGFTIGNHDGSGAIVKQELIFKEERELAKEYWQNIESDSNLNFVDKNNYPFSYSFQQNNIFYLVWDASTHIISPQQIAWTKKSLSSKTARKATMRIAIGHLPLYPVAQKKNKPGEYLADGEKLRNLLEKYRVHTYISGHHHAYYPGKKNKLELLHAGALGQGARQLINSNLLPQNTITIVDIDKKIKNTIYTTYDIKTGEKIEYEQLPKFIPLENNDSILRRDLSDR